MQSRLNPYINYKGNARKAIEFYHSIFGGKLDMTTFKEGGMPTDATNENNIMHAMLVADNGMTIMASDTPEGMMEYKAGNNISISLSGYNESELSGYYNKLSEGGTQVEPLVKAPWGDMFGIVADKFGIMWMVNIAAKAA